MIAQIEEYFEKQGLVLDDRTKEKIQEEESLKEKFYQLINYVFENPTINHQVRLKLQNFILNLGKQNRIPFIIALSHTCISRIYEALGHFIKSINSANQANIIWADLKNEPLAINGLIQNYINLINGYSKIGLEQYVLEYMDLVEHLLETRKDVSKISQIRYFLLVGYKFLEQNKLEDSEIFYKKGLNLAGKLEIPNLTVTSETGYCNLLIRKGKINDALKRLKKLLKLSEKNGLFHAQISILSLAGECYLKNKKMDSALKHFMQSHELQKKYKFRLNLGENVLRIAIIYFKQQKFKKSINELSKIIYIKEEIENKSILMECYKTLFKCYKRIYEFKKSNKYLKLYADVLEKSIQDKEKVLKQNEKQIINFFSDKIHQLQKDNKLLEMKNSQVMKNRNMVTGSMISASSNDFLNQIKTDVKSEYNSVQLVSKIEKKQNEYSNWDDYLKIIENVHPNFVLGLKTLTENKISQQEVRICSFIKLGFDKYEIAGILGISVRGVEQHRYRIHKKMKDQSKLLNEIIDLIEE